jgi:hypothetical protein
MFLQRLKIIIILGILGVLGIASYVMVFQFFAGQTVSYDLVIKHVQILDGTGEKEIYRGDIAVKDGRIAEIGQIASQNHPVFDAGGLTVMPVPPKIEKTDGLAEHLFRTSFPRYPAHYLYFQEDSGEVEEGLNLAQLAQQRGETPEETFYYLQSRLPVTTKVYLVPLELEEQRLQAGDYALAQLVAYCTGFPAMTAGKTDVGMIKPGYKADLSFFISHDYEEETLKRLFLKGECPGAALLLHEGKFVTEQVAVTTPEL